MWVEQFRYHADSWLPLPEYEPIYEWVNCKVPTREQSAR